MAPQQTVDGYIQSHPEWQEGLQILRQILKSTKLEETIKWGAPVYTLADKNVVGIGAFKSYLGLWFYQGVFLDDPNHLLVNAQEEKTKALRQMRFRSVEELNAAVVLEYIQQAIRNQEQGKELKAERDKELVLPDEFKEKLSSDSALAKAFDALTPGKQREYADYIAEAKRTETRSSRLQKIDSMIRQGVGLNDRYK